MPVSDDVYRRSRPRKKHGQEFLPFGILPEEVRIQERDPALLAAYASDAFACTAAMYAARRSLGIAALDGCGEACVGEGSTGAGWPSGRASRPQDAASRINTAAVEARRWSSCL
ncbi:hypothetical protein [Polyangium mundeleinium]|uniref:Uncharacterized protein n=1 Tax=Polyangium mundeleinium TaxID=2995306 RepID=A0ABT5EZA3_9BACT|nr:hypothetical protein [Polyangium mundeleinium]MDC0746141.1 hypothetical protein [Polyangium mundeleinium]